MYKMLPPVGEPIRLGPRSDPPEFTGFHSVWTQSGTAALALAVRLAMDQRPDVARPEVLIPAHGCPDLVAAVRFAGAIPILVDIGPEDPGFDPASLEQAWTKATVAVVAVNFLGIRERVHDLAHAATTRNTWLIEDSAQWYPEPQADENEPFSPTDAVILSFGRGKPVSLLGGGALLVREGRESNPALESLKAAPNEWLPALKIALYNQLLQPRWYGLIGRNPLLSVGGTHYAPLVGVQAMASWRLELLGSNAAAWLDRDRWRETAISEMLISCEAVAVNLPHLLKERTRRLLRYPLLCRDRETRDRLLAQLVTAGLGATAMYREALPWVPGVAPVLDVIPALPGARAFAEHLLTLPVHDGVSRKDIECMEEVIRSEVTIVLEN